MTAILHRPTDEPSDPTGQGGPVILGQILELSPQQVAQHPDNIRDATRHLPALTASVAEVGVLVPLIVVPVDQVPGHEWPHGTTHVAVDGNRRQAAAQAAGVPLPCVVREDLATAKATVRTMAVTSLVRDGLTATEEAYAVAALFDLKYSAAAISRATGRSKAHLAAARTAATLTGPAATAVTDYPLTIDQLAVIAAWQDQPDAVAKLITAAASGRMEHVAAQLRGRQLENEAVAKRCAELAAQCVSVVEVEPRSHGAGPARPLTALRPADTASGRG